MPSRASVSSPWYRISSASNWKVRMAIDYGGVAVYVRQRDPYVDLSQARASASRARVWCARKA